jgi:phosphatidate cytidylyltransferase
MLRQRVITALALGALALLAIFLLPHAAIMGVLALLVIAGAWEWSAFPRFTQSSARIAYVAVVAVAIGATWLFSRNGAELTELLYVSILWWVVALIWIITIPAVVSGASAAVAGLFVLIPAWFALVKLHEHGPSVLLFLLLLVVAADVGAYFSGRQFGRNKLAPRVSPGKTWEGVLGGLCGAAIVAVVGVSWFEVPAAPFVALSLVAVLASIIGDLTESLFKRHAGIKDSGSLLPGHGGVLDRVDSVTAAAPVFLIGLERLGLFR